MSFKESLEVLKNQIIQKNVVLVSGNIEDIVLVDLLSQTEELDKIKKVATDFITIVDYIKSIVKSEKETYDVIKYFSLSKGLIDIRYENHQPNVVEEGEEDDENDVSKKAKSKKIIDIEEFIDTVSNALKTKEWLKNTSGSLYIVECDDHFLNQLKNKISPNKFAELINNFIMLNSNSNLENFLQYNKKLVLLTKNPEVLINFVPTSNLEFHNVVIEKPCRRERNIFFQSFQKWFDLKNTFHDSNHSDYQEALTISQGLSFKELLQLAKFNHSIDNKPTFKQLYNMANFNKKNSEWENINIAHLRNINELLSKRVKGQKFAIDAIEKTLIRSFTGLNGITQSSNSKKPKGVLFLAGPTGTGKTEITKTLCEFVFGDEKRLIRFDMSEYNLEHSDQKLIGSPPGYIGYDEGGQLTTAVKNNPFSILLFDEIEKAHPKILDKFLQILEDGRLTSSQGETIDFSETFIVFTSNIGSSIIDIEESEVEIQKQFIKTVEDYFKHELKRPEILNRIGIKNIIPFNFIKDPAIIKDIIQMKIDSIIKKIKNDKKINCLITEKTITAIAESIINKYDKSLGGRGLVIELETEFIDRFSMFIFNHYETIIKNKNDNKFSNIIIEFNNNQIDFAFS